LVCFLEPETEDAIFSEHRPNVYRHNDMKM